MTRMTGPDCVVMCNLINTHTHTSLIPPWEDQREWHRMTRMARLDCAVMLLLLLLLFLTFSALVANPKKNVQFNTYIHTHTHTHTPFVACAHTHAHTDTAVNRARMPMSPNEKYTWCINKSKQHYIYIYSQMDASARTLNFPLQLTTSRCGNLTRLIHIPLLKVNGGRKY